MNSVAYMKSPIGELTIVEAGDDSVVEVFFGHRDVDAPRKRRAFAATQLEEYFNGVRKTFDLVLAPRGTDFQLSVWNALRAIPYGATRSYAEVAQTIGRPSAVRAVGAANGANPIPIFIPCHRVIGSNGSLTGFGGGIDVKRRLLDFEAGYRRLL